ncbi:MAG: hypothetical protein PHO66_05620, partial [Eubacteriales bacterium]|nr:hypothetical protein [Eubacteriales bacterium]
MDVACIGITSVNGYPLAMEERFERMARAGFGAVLLWWGDGEPLTRRQRVDLANRYGLRIENAHAPTDGVNALWADTAAGDAPLRMLCGALDDCAHCSVGRLVVHLTSGAQPPAVTAAGTRRIERLVERARNCGVQLAFENMRASAHVCHVLDAFDCETVGL